MDVIESEEFDVDSIKIDGNRFLTLYSICIISTATAQSRVDVV